VTSRIVRCCGAGRQNEMPLVWGSDFRFVARAMLDVMWMPDYRNLRE
jgi:hypothetical protein